jgi:hypothetical protein
VYVGPTSPIATWNAYWNYGRLDGLLLDAFGIRPTHTAPATARLLWKLDPKAGRRPPQPSA